MKLWIKLVCVLILVATMSCEQGELDHELEFARWKGNAQSAYSLILDDYGARYFGDTSLIINSLKTHNLPITFAVIANWRENLHDEGPKYWSTANGSLSGNGFVNHSWDHDIPSFSMAKDVEMAQTKIEKVIHSNECMFFCFPGGQKYKRGIGVFVDSMRVLKYIGARAGKSDDPINPYEISDPFKINTAYYGNHGKGVEVLNTVLDSSIALGNWAVHSMHNVDRESWGMVDHDVWTAHLKYCQEKVDSGLVWMAPVQQVLKYAMERQNYTIRVAEQSDREWRFFIDTSKEINPSPKVFNATYAEHLTVIAGHGGHKYHFEIDPMGGEVVLNRKNGRLKSVRQNKKNITFKRMKNE